MGKIRAWFWAIRPFTISAAVVPVFVGSALAFRDGTFSIARFIPVLVASVLVQITTNLVDEYSDHSRPEGKKKLPAPYKVITLGLLSAQEVKRGALLCFTVASAIGIYLVILTGWPILLMCLASAVAVYFYSAGPRPLGKIGLGQPLVFVFMGMIMVVGSYYVQTGAFTSDSFLLSLPVGCTVTAILAANDMRDMEEDRVAGKKTIVTILGRRSAWWEYLLIITAAFTIMIMLVATNRLGPVVLISLLALPQAIMALLTLYRGNSRAKLAPGLPSTSRLHLYFGVLIALGVSLDRFFH